MRTRWAIGLVAVAIVVGLVVARRHEIVRFAIERAAGLATGYSVGVADQRIGPHALVLLGLHVARGGRPLLDAERVEVRYSLRDLLPGSRRRFGLAGIEIRNAKLTIARLANGSYNFNIPSAPAGPPVPQRVNPVPIRFGLRVRDAELDLVEAHAFDPSAKNVRIDGITIDATVDTSTVTHYRASGAFHELKKREPFTMAGRIDVPRGYAMHRIRAARFPLRALSNYFAYTRAVRILKGRARNLDARLYSLDVGPNVAPSYHVSLRFDTDGGRIALESLAVPLNDIRGRIQVVDNFCFLNQLHATLAGIPLHITGGIFDLTGALTGVAQLRLGIYGTGDLHALRQAFTFTRDQDVSGGGRLGVLVEGPIDNPLIVARTVAPHVRYRGLAFDSLLAGIVYHDSVVALAPLRLNYAGIGIGVRGTMTVGAHLQSSLVLHVSGLASRLPYLDEMLGNEPMLVDGAVRGTDFLFHVRAAAASARGTGRVAALVALDPNGTAAVDPFWFHTARGDFDGGYLLDRPHKTSAFWAIADNLQMHAPSAHAFPGLDLPVMPPVESRRIAMTVAGGGSGNHIVVAGIVSGNHTTIAGVRFDRIAAAFGGTLQDAAINVLHASGPWGGFDGHGAFSSQRLVAYGSYRGRFEGLQPFLGSTLPGHGPISGTVAVAVEPRGIEVQGTDLAMPGASLHGIPLTRASMTLAIEGNRLRVYSAHAHAAGGDVVAAGSFSLAPAGRSAGTGSLALVANHLDAAQLRGIGLPLDAGRLWASGSLAAGAPLPGFAGGVTLANGRVAHVAVAGGGDVRLSGDAATLQRTIGAVGDTYTRVDGTIGALSSGTPQYALEADVPAASIESALRSFGFPTYAADGSFNARLSIGGRGTAPHVTGRVGVPAGSVNGLPFVDGSASVAADPSGASIHHGRVLIGTTSAHFTAVVQPGEKAVHVSAPRADLSDFNNFFDTGDTLDGNGSVKFAAAASRARITSSGDIDVRLLRYRNLPIGDTRALWSSSRNVVTGSLAVEGSEGRLRARGSVAVAPERDPQAMLKNSRLNLSGNVDDLDLSLWMPALGFATVPITGRASGQAAVRGRFPQFDLSADGSVAGGTLGPLTLENAQFAVHSVGRRVSIDRAELTTPELSASATGSIGLRTIDPLDVRVHAATDNLSQLIYELTRTRAPLTGSFESTLQVGGTMQAPTFLAGFDATGVRAYGIPIAALFGEARLQGRTLVLSNAGATFQQGEATLAGSLPLRLAPLRLGAPNDPVNSDLDVVDLDPAIFDAVLGANTKLGGRINGHLGLSGTVGNPIVVGHASLTGGTYVSDLDRIPIKQAAATLSFSRAVASIDRASASLGSGSVAGSGMIEFPNGLEATGTSLEVKGVAKGAQLDLPAYGTGTLDAKLALTKTATASMVQLAGSVTLSNAALPFSSFLKAAQQSEGSGGQPLPLAFNLQASAGKNVRVRGSGYGAGLDIGTAGSVHLGGTLAAPTLKGSIASTGGTLTYFDRAFRVQQGTVRFDPSDGLVPTIDAVATTSVVNPDPDRARNPYGSADVTIKVDGQIPNVKIAFSSNPSGYSRDQIIALIAPFGGFINGIGFSNQSALAVQQPNGITPFGQLSPLPNVALQQRSGITVGQEAFNVLNAQFIAGLLSPVENTLGQGLGLSSVNLTLGYYGNVGFTATRLLGKEVSAVYAVTFGLPQVQSFGLQIQPSAYTSATLSFFNQSGPTKLLQLPGSTVGYNQQYLLGQPLLGNNGFSVTVQRYFK